LAYGEAHDYTVNVVEYINIKEISQGISIYPNPSSDGLFTIEFKNVDMENIRLQVFNAMGKIIYEKHLTLSNQQKEPIHLPGISTGIFFLKLQSESGIYTEKLIIK